MNQSTFAYRKEIPRPLRTAEVPTVTGRTNPTTRRETNTCPRPRTATATDRGTSTHHETRRGDRRRLLFRCVRLALVGGLVGAVSLLVLKNITSATSEQAYINGEMIVLRAPIGGTLHLETVVPGQWLASDAPVFRVENPRYGNQEATAQMNFARELADRLRAEAAEAQVRLKQQEQAFALHEKLFRELLISRLAFIEEETRLAVARAAATSKELQLRQAEARLREVERQAELQKDAVVSMPLDGTAWAIPAKNGALVAAHEPVLQVVDPGRIWVDAFFHERHAARLQIGATVTVQTTDRRHTWSGRIESVRGGVGRIAYENFLAAAPGEVVRRRVSVRVQMQSPNPYAANEFFGIGRNVIVRVNNRE